jgi:hypothetical protein
MDALTEIRDVRQIPGDGHRRWFTGGVFDLIVWYEGGSITGFQLCYDKLDRERALTWRASGGYGHTRIDDGERMPGPKMTPILVQDGWFDKDSVGRRFLAAAGGIDPSVVSLVSRRIAEYR